MISRGVVVKILFYKKPSHIHKVKYKKAIDDLYNANISDNKLEDNKNKKTLANIAFCLLENLITENQLVECLMALRKHIIRKRTVVKFI